MSSGLDERCQGQHDKVLQAAQRSLCIEQLPYVLYLLAMLVYWELSGIRNKGGRLGGRGTLSKEAVRVVKHLAVRGIESGTTVRMRSAQSTVTVHIFQIRFILALKIGKDFQVDHIA